MMAWVPAAVLILALIIDRVAGDPESRLHPVALLGRFIGWWGRPALWAQKVQRAAGVVMWVATVLLFSIPFFLVQKYIPWYLFLIAGAVLLKFCLAWKSLEEHTESVVKSLELGLAEGQRQVSRMVSRSTGKLDRQQVLSAAYESMTENLVDSIISPLFFYGIFGLTGAAGYRAANTMDAMLGYRDERERLGWFSARMDDILNYIPARITAVLLLLYFAAKGRFAQAWAVLIRDRHKRPGINGGIPMAIMAGGTGVRFEKPGVYSIGSGEKDLNEAGWEIVAAVRAVVIMFSLLVIITLILLGSMSIYIGI